MDRKHQITICKECSHRKFDKNKGLICGLTDDIQSFEVQCDSFSKDSNSKSILDRYDERSIERGSYEDAIERKNERLEKELEEKKLQNEILKQEINNNSVKQSSIQAYSSELKRINSGANWFIIISVLSIINSILIHSGSEINFIFGLGSTTLLDVLIRDMGEGQSILWLIPQFIIAGLFFFFGYAGKKLSNSAYLIGIILYSLDALIFFLFKNYIAIGFHLFALFGMVNGFSKLLKLKKERKDFLE